MAFVFATLCALTNYGIARYQKFPRRIARVFVPLGAITWMLGCVIEQLMWPDGKWPGRITTWAIGFCSPWLSEWIAGRRLRR